MTKKGLFIFVICCFIFTGVFAGGKKDVTDRSVGDKNSWQETFDINQKPSGKYNIMVTAKDKAGNEQIAGPYNIKIDTESDLPVAGITNPSENMRIPGNLNIVGTCVDDDAVQQVNIIFDGDEDNIQTAEGKDFWSYYLDTNSLKEGPHTIEVYGTDVNGLRGHSVKLTWQLDRRAPVTTVTNVCMGTLVSSKIDLNGTIQDGNGISKLEYSLDGGQYFSELKIKDVKLKEADENGLMEYWDFSVPIDTRKSPDGPAVCWFKATDKAGSVGIYSFLYFIDNTSPDVKIVSPADEEVNGTFTVAGFAKDTIGIQRLSWNFGGETGDFDLIAGNPYWVKEVNSIGSKNAEFSITAVDTAGNVVTVKKSFKVNQELDKPVVTISSPLADSSVEGTDGSFFIRGRVTDDDGVASVTYKVDSGEETTFDCLGVFYASIPGELSNGTHTVTVYATDKYGVVGNKVTNTFTAKGVAPVFNKATLFDGKNTKDFVDGVTVNPDADVTYQTAAVSTCGLSAVTYEFSWGAEGHESNAITLKGGEKKVDVKIPLKTLPWGVVKLTIKATDVFERTTEHHADFYIKNLSRVYTDKPGVYFTDSTVAEDGAIVNDAENPVTGYFVGGNIKKAELVPATKAATVSFEGNSIILTAGEGGSAAEVVRVTTDKGAVYNSRQIYFISNGEKPNLTLDDSTEDSKTPVDIADSVTIKGTTDSSGVTVSYRILSAQVAYSPEGIVTSSTANAVPSLAEAKPVSLRKSGAFTIELKNSDFVDGMSVVEVISSNASGQSTTKSVYVRKIATLPEASTEPDADGNLPPPLPAPAAPAIYWLQGNNLYAVAVYQGYTNATFDVFKSDDLIPGKNNFAFAVSTLDSTEPVSSTYSITKSGGITARISNINGTPYESGMSLILERGAEKEASHKATVTIKSASTINKVDWQISGEDAPGGDVAQSGTILTKNIRTVVDGEEYEFDIPLQNLPSRITNITATIVNSNNNTFNLKGTIFVLRTQDEARIDDSADIYWTVLDGVTYETSRSRYILNGGASLTGYANIQSPITVSLAAEKEGLAASSEGNLVRIDATKDGLYKDVVLKVTDAGGAVYSSNAVTLLVDTANPTVEIKSPVAMSWIQQRLVLEGTASDGNGIASLEFSYDNQATWNLIALNKDGSFKVTTDLSALADGIVPIDLRATDNSGKITILNNAVQKDTEAPVVKVIVPDAEAVVNGENVIAFSVTDSGSFNKVNYTSANKKITTEIPITSMSNTFVGTEEQPIDNTMTFSFADKAGNVATLNTWEFKVDSESDLPRAEIHLPVDNEVITRDFVVSGVIYDDDGPSKIWYKMDDGDYQALPEYGTSFNMTVPLSAMTDNEHSVTVYAEDINGVKGLETSRKFRISLEEPKGAVTAPVISETVKGTVTLKGVASDKNGIKKVQISVDNGASFNDAIGTTEWTYNFDTRVIQDATHVVFVKIWDGYDITGLYSSLINVDNTSPNLSLELPLDDSKTTKNVFFSGQTTDNIGLKQLYITVRSLDSNKSVPSKLARTDLVPAEIISQSIDLSSLDNGFYNIQLTGTDAAGNITRVSRNIQLDKTKPLTNVDLLYPLNGENCHGVFNIYGTATSEEDPIASVTLYVDDKTVAGLEPTVVTESGYFKFVIKPSVTVKTTETVDGEEKETKSEVEMMSEGQHKYKVIATTESGKQIISNEQYVVYSKSGPWVTLDNFTYGDFAMNRPMLKGDAGYTLSDEEVEALKAKETAPEKRAAIEKKTIKQVMLSFDNGKTYTAVSKEKKGKWQYRVENEDISEGFHFLLIKAEMMNGENAITRLIVQVDHTKPTIKLISPGEGGHYNQQLEFSGLTSDDVSLKDVTLTLRKGDKAAYEVPGFIQGLYFDGSVWGASLWQVGVGLTAFDNAVKIQANYGQFTQEERDFISSLLGLEQSNLRFGGRIVGAKIIAQLGYLPFRYLFGRDWDWLSATLSVGANFSYFTQSGAIDRTTGEPVAQVLSAALVQIEFPRVTIKEWKRFKTWAFYIEPQVWFIPSDIASDDANKIVPTVSFGIRTNVF